MPRKALTHDLASATVRYLRINADQTTTELTAAQLRVALGAQLAGVQYLTANAVWDGSLFVTNDAAWQLSFAGWSAPIFVMIFAGGGNITLTNSPGGIIDGVVSTATSRVAWCAPAEADGNIQAF